MSARIHPQLRNEIDQPGDRPLNAVIQLRPRGSPDEIPSPQEAGQLADAVLNRVQSLTGLSPIRTNMMNNLASVMVEAQPAFLRSLVDQPEVIAATPADTGQSPFIPPKNKRPA